MNEAIPQVNRFRSFFLEPGSFLNYLVRLAPAASSAGIESHQFNFLILLKTALFISDCRKAVKSRAIIAVFVASDNTDFHQVYHPFIIISYILVLFGIGW